MPLASGTASQASSERQTARLPMYVTGLRGHCSACSAGVCRGSSHSISGLKPTWTQPGKPRRPEVSTSGSMRNPCHGPRAPPDPSDRKSSPSATPDSSCTGGFTSKMGPNVPLGRGGSMVARSGPGGMPRPCSATMPTPLQDTMPSLKAKHVLDCPMCTSVMRRGAAE